MSKPFFVLSTLVCFFLTDFLAAQKPPELGYAFPPAIQIGKKSHVQLGGFDFTPDLQFIVHDDSVGLSVDPNLGDFLVPGPPYWFGEKSRATAFPIPREFSATVHVPTSCSTGFVPWQVANANGSSQASRFYLSHTKEILEKRVRNQPQSLPELPLGVSGRLERITEVDRYSFLATQHGLVTIELMARAVGTDLNGVLTVYDDQGQQVADATDLDGSDLAVTFPVQINRRYVVGLHDIDYRGHSAMIYRLAFSYGPRVIAIDPPTLPPGQPTMVQFIGYGVATGQPMLETTSALVDASGKIAGEALKHRLKTPSGTAPVITIPIVEPTGQSWHFPLDSSGTASHSFEAVKGESLEIRAQTTAFENRHDLAMEIIDANGKKVAENDDVGDSVHPGLQLLIPSDGTYRCKIRDVSGEATGPSNFYLLSIHRTKNSFSFKLPQQINIPVGGKFDLPIKVKRKGGHDAEIQFKIIGLPKGMSIEQPVLIAAGQNEGKIKFDASATRIAASNLISIIGLTKDQPKSLPTHSESELLAAHPADFQENSSTEKILLTTTLTPQFSIELVDKNRQRAVHRGTTYPAPFMIKRTNGFEGSIELMMAARQGRHRQGITAAVTTVAGNQNRVEFPCFMPEWLETDRTTRMVVLGTALQKDPQGNQRYLTQLANARVTMILEGALMKLAHAGPAVVLQPGDQTKLTLSLSRSAKLSGPIRLELIPPSPIEDLIHSKPKTNPALKLKTEIPLTVSTQDDPRLNGTWKMKLRATALQENRWPVVSETEVEFDFSNK